MQANITTSPPLVSDERVSWINSAENLANIKQLGEVIGSNHVSVGCISPRSTISQIAPLCMSLTHAFLLQNNSFNANLLPNKMIVSTIIPTIGRSLLDRAVDSVLAQRFSGSFEIIVVNDSGRSLRPADWQQSAKVRIVSTHQRERSVARNTGAALSTGRYLHFLDDDDWLLPGAYQSLYDLAVSGGAMWLYGGTQLMDRQGNKLIELHHDMVGNCALPTMAGEWIPLQSSWIDTKFFFASGGFNPLMPAGQDTELIRRIALKTEVVGTTKLVSCVGVGVKGSSTDTVRRKPDLQISRESILEMSETFSRLRAGATSAYWSGRLARIYLTSAVGNLQRGKITTAVSRFWIGFLSGLLAGGRVLSKEFWLALFKPYRNETFNRGFKAAGQDSHG